MIEMNKIEAQNYQDACPHFCHNYEYASHYKIEACMHHGRSPDHINIFRCAIEEGFGECPLLRDEIRIR